MKDSGLVVIDEKNGGSDKFWNRAMIPILDINGKVIGFGGRVMGDAKPKYINTSDTVVFDKKPEPVCDEYSTPEPQERIYLLRRVYGCHFDASGRLLTMQWRRLEPRLHLDMQIF